MKNIDLNSFIFYVYINCEKKAECNNQEIAMENFKLSGL